MIHNMYNPDPNERELSSNEDSDEFREYQTLKEEYETTGIETMSFIQQMAELDININDLEYDEIRYFRDLQIRRRRTKDRLDELKLDLESQGMGGFI